MLQVKPEINTKKLLKLIVFRIIELSKKGSNYSVHLDFVEFKIFSHGKCEHIVICDHLSTK
jgi:hypothetical protein